MRVNLNLTKMRWRYDQLYEICRVTQPRAILEVGTHAGNSALEMILAADARRYVGFDLFEDATEETDKREFNVKARPNMSEVRDTLERNTDASILLVKGDTRDTLPYFVETSYETFDLAFIDGGHSVETIRNDWECVRQLMGKNSVVIFDDYYTGVENMGCNEIVKDLDAVILPIRDKVKKKDFIVQMALVQLKG